MPTATIAPKTIARCPRCCMPIIKRTRVEVRPDGSYVHFGCKAPGGSQLTSPASNPPVVDIEAIWGDRVNNTIDAAIAESQGAVSDAVAAKRDPLDDSDADEMVDRVYRRVKSGMMMAVGGAVDAVMPEIRVDVRDQVSRAIVSEASKMQGHLNEVQKSVLKTAEDIKGQTNRFLDALHQTAMAEIVRTVNEHAVKIVKHVHVIQRPDGKEVEFDKTQTYHKAFGEVLDLLSIGLNIFLPGPTGCGKTHLAKQIADVSGMDFGLISGTAGTTESEIFGTSVPNISTGENCYIESDFVRLYENGGVFLLDEGDAMDPNCLLKINAAIANDYCSVPKRYGKPKAVRHKNFRFIMAANTWGNGASRQYCGRNKLDEATLDRLRNGTVPMDYDPAVEVAVVHGDTELYSLLVSWRKSIFANKIQRVLSTRFMAGSWKLKHHLKKSPKYIAEKLTGGWTDREIEIVVGDLS